MSMEKRKNLVLPSLAIGATAYRTSGSASPAGGPTKLSASLHHWTGAADLADISALMSVVSCSDDSRLLSVDMSTPSTPRVHTGGAGSGPTWPPANGSHCTSRCCATGLQTAPAVTQGPHTASATSTSCAHTGSHCSCCYSRSNSTDSACSTYKVAESPDVEWRSSNAKVVCSPLLGTSNIWSESVRLANSGQGRNVLTAHRLLCTARGARDCARGPHLELVVVTLVSNPWLKASTPAIAFIYRCPIVTQCLSDVGTAVTPSRSGVPRFESSPSVRASSVPALPIRHVTTPTETFGCSTDSTLHSASISFMQPTQIAAQFGLGVTRHGVESLASSPERDMDSSQLLDILESVARRRRSSLFSGNRIHQLENQSITWRGVLQPKDDATGRTLSRKVFVGGLSRDMNSRCLLEAFQAFGVERIEWYPRAEKGFAYAIFRRESKLRTLLNVCSRDVQGRYYFKVGTLRPYRERQVQLIPWLVDDSDLPQFEVEGGRPEISNRTVFVGALHGEMTAKDLAIVMQETFGTVLAVGLDTDKFKYPCGTARVTFQHPRSQASALKAGYIRVESNKFTKTLQIDPFLQDVLCTTCYRGPGPVFCRHFSCFTYFCPA
ncbi:Cytoplasmic polyadenylation element-binding-like [Tropilaelaps mercedesae]|uniref:Cytoplasmic polyadenylation element-binding-like n=1 Tax=Tropilaelaps mercedesae TaxID=418985 RepID=A0A1V9X1B8_9ACAR|nr:Cytoplasmic polyadenylation element-binding-like [Tropilaelaps mercedesae]